MQKLLEIDLTLDQIEERDKLSALVQSKMEIEYKRQKQANGEFYEMRELATKEEILTDFGITEEILDDLTGFIFIISYFIKPGEYYYSRHEVLYNLTKVMHVNLNFEL